MKIYPWLFLPLVLIGFNSAEAAGKRPTPSESDTAENVSAKQSVSSPSVAPPSDTSQDQDPPSKVEILFTDPRQVEALFRNRYPGRSTVGIRTDMEVLYPETLLWPANWKTRMLEADPISLRKWNDWDLWGQLNTEARTVWQAMVRCNLGDPELARIAYYYAKNLCSRSEAEGRKIFDQLQRLHGRIRDFIRTTQLKTIDLQGLQKKTEDEATLHKAATEGLIPLHPLFTQIAFEYLATVSRFFAKDSMERWTSPVPPHWIDYPYSRAFMERVNCVLFQPADCSEWPTEIPDNPGVASHARSYVNAHLIVRFFYPLGYAEEARTEPPYARFGLWPRASLALLKVASWQFPRRSAWKNWDLEQRFDNPISQLTKRMPGARAFGAESGRGFIPYVTPASLPQDLEEFSGTIVTEFRALAQRYGLETYRARRCDPEKKDRCFAVDPSNPDVKTDPYDWN